MSSVTKTFREQKIKIGPGSVETVYFSDTSPNYVRIANPSTSSLYIGKNANVNTQAFDLIVNPFANKLYVSPVPLKQFSILSSHNEAIEVVIASWEDAFNPAAMPQSTEMVGLGEGGILGVVEVNNILSPLPPGTNHIGLVSISNMVSLPSGNNLIGRVEVDELPPISLEPSTAAIGQVGLLPGTHVIGFTRPAPSQSKLLTVTTTGTENVFNGPCTVHKVVFKDGASGHVFNGTVKVWDGELDYQNGLLCTTSLDIEFMSPGSAWVIYTEGGV